MQESRQSSGAWTRTIAPALFLLFAAGVTLIGLAMLGLGLLLALRGGSVFYIGCGALLAASGVQLFRRRSSATHLAALAFIITWLWALAEVGLDGWALLPRVNLISVLLPLYALPFIRSRLRPESWIRRAAVVERYYPPTAVLVVVVVIALVGIDAWRAALPDEAQATPRAAAEANAEDWRHFGQNAGGTRFSSLSEIDRSNAGMLGRVWEYVESAPTQTSTLHREEATPLAIAGKLYACLSNNVILALDSEDGRLLWRHDPHTDLTGHTQAICRGVAYFEDAARNQCPKRILFGTLDARLIALNAETGEPCADFGENGEVSLRSGLGPYEPGMYAVTSPPTIVRGIAIVGALVRDNVATNEPSGVIRGFDARTGRLVWAWDMGRAPTRTGPLGANEIYTRGTPNAWSLFSADEQLGLVYLPMGNATPDFVGAHREQAWEPYSSAVVALDAATGRPRWTHQFVHHDVWDYDVPGQPVLADLPMGDGVAPALIQATKQGEIFILDRRTGEPLSEIVERPTPQTDVPGEYTAPTQPFSAAMPNVGGPQLREEDMWGISPFDQMLCRYRFRGMRYEGMFTPPSLQRSIEYPGQAGGVSWGSVTIDSARQILFVPSFRLASTVRLVPRNTVPEGVSYSDSQQGTPYIADNALFMSRLGVPCQRPPYSMLTAINLRSRAILWQRPLGTAEDIGPFGIASHLPITVGAPPLVGGAVATAGDVLFIGAVGDRRLRAIDSLTGRELWSDKLPEGNQATPITYRAPRSGRQFVVIVSGGYMNYGAGRTAPTHIVAYSLH